MKKLTKLFILILIPFFSAAQSNIFRSNLDANFHIFSKGITTILDTSKYSDDINKNFLNLSIGRFFGVSSFSIEDGAYSTYLMGLTLKANFRNKLKLIAFYDYLDGNHYSEIRKYNDSLGVYFPGFGIDNDRLQFNAKYLANKFITLDIGNGKQFIGDGYQSLLLSDVASSYPYLKITTEFGPVKYYNLYTTFINHEMVDYGRKKHATIHYLDFAITDKIHLGVFESILWQSKSESIDRGYEIAYLNPVIFFRPVEFSKRSSQGNALLGVNFRASFKKTIFYGQFMLDDLNISRQEDRDENYQEGFFQNKYGYQFGLRTKIKDIRFLIEYNQVTPYTYGHRTILQNYSHMNQALAHPLGANFKELINVIELRNGNWSYKLKAMFTRVGLDSANTHYGQNIFESDYEASTGGQYSYGNFAGQGVYTSVFSFQPEFSFKLKWFDVFASLYYRKKKSDLIDQTLIFYSVGLRNFPFSTFQDY